MSESLTFFEVGDVVRIANPEFREYIKNGKRGYFEYLGDDWITIEYQDWMTIYADSNFIIVGFDEDDENLNVELQVEDEENYFWLNTAVLAKVAKPSILEKAVDL